MKSVAEEIMKAQKLTVREDIKDYYFNQMQILRAKNLQLTIYMTLTTREERDAKWFELLKSYPRNLLFTRT